MYNMYTRVYTTILSYILHYAILYCTLLNIYTIILIYIVLIYIYIGVEYEFLKRYDQSIINYRKGVEIAEHYLGMFICTCMCVYCIFI